MELSFFAAHKDVEEEKGEYERIWDRDGETIVNVMEEVSGITFKEDHVKVVVHQGASYSGGRGDTIKLHSNFSKNHKKGVLVHELCHRLIFDGEMRSHLDNHKRIYLILYDIWTELEGEEFADSNVEREKTSPVGDPEVYAAAWDWALSLSRDERQQKFHEMVVSQTSHT